MFLHKKRILYYLVLQFFSTKCFFDDPTTHESRDFVVISLGSDCHPAAYTRKHSIRDFAFPFDWCLTPFDSIYHFIKNDFAGYLKKKNLVQSEEKQFNHSLKKFLQKTSLVAVSTYQSWVVDKKNGMIFVHDFPDNRLPVIAKWYKDIARKYERRIKRFKAVMDGSKHVYLIRYLDTTKKQALELEKLLRKNFPHARFTLIIIGNTPEFNHNWGYQRIKNYALTSDRELFWELLCEDIATGKLK